MWVEKKSWNLCYDVVILIVCLEQEGVRPLKKSCCIALCDWPKNLEIYGLLFKETMSLLQPTSNSVELCGNYEYVMHVLKFKLRKETCLLAGLHCQTLLSDWLAFSSSLVITYIKWAVKGTWAFVNNPLLVMAKIKLIESLCSTKHTTIRYNGLKIRLLLTDLVALKSIWQLIPVVVIFLLKDIFKPPPHFLVKF